MRVAGIFRSGLFEYDSTWIYVAFETASAFAGNSHAASVMSVQVSDADNVKQVSADVSNTLGDGYTIVDWQQANQPLFSALALERRMGLFIIGLIIAIAALNITTMLILVVVERRRDIAILNALGATRAGVMLVFMIEGAVVGAIGAIAGVVIGLVACFIGNYYKLVSLPADVYSISNVPLTPRPSEMFLAALVAFVLSVLATIYPARARIAPATGRGAARLMIDVVDLRKSFVAPNGERIEVLRGVTFSAKPARASRSLALGFRQIDAASSARRPGNTRPRNDLV